MKNIILFPIVLIVIIYFSISFIIPLFQERASLRTQIAEQELRKEKLETDLQAVQTFVAQGDQHAAEQLFLESFIPMDPREQDIVNAISRLSEESGVSLFIIGFSEQFNNRGYRTSDVEQNVQFIESTINVTGTYENMYAFLAKLFRMNRLYALNLIHIEKMEVDTGDENAQNQPAQLQMTASFQYAYVPEDIHVAIEQLRHIDYTTVNRIQNIVATTGAIEARAEKRANPFVP